jgi:hypothetical protein
MSLQNLQADFAEEIFQGMARSELVHPAQNISIYQHNMIACLTRTLQETYPLITKLVGQDFFPMAAKEYIQQYPSRSSNLHDYGAYFSDFLATYPPVHDLIYLTEVAQFEWACHRLYFAPDHRALDVTTLGNFSESLYENLHFALHPASKLIKFHFPIIRIIELCKGDIDGDLDISQGGVNLLLIRRELDISLVELTLAEFTFLDMLNDNKSLLESLNTALLIDADFKLEEKLKNWVIDKTIVDCYLVNAQ